MATFEIPMTIKWCWGYYAIRACMKIRFRYGVRFLAKRRIPISKVWFCRPRQGRPRIELYATDTKLAQTFA